MNHVVENETNHNKIRWRLSNIENRKINDFLQTYILCVHNITNCICLLVIFSLTLCNNRLLPPAPKTPWHLHTCNALAAAAHAWRAIWPPLPPREWPRCCVSLDGRAAATVHVSDSTGLLCYAAPVTAVLPRTIVKGGCCSTLRMLNSLNGRIPVVKIACPQLVINCKRFNSL